MNTRDAARQMRRDPTPAEERLWAALRRHQLDGRQFRRQHPVGRFIADFYCHEPRLVVEVDGAIHTLPEQAVRDHERDELFRSLKLRVLRVTSEEVLCDLPSVIERIRSTCRGDDTPSS